MKKILITGGSGTIGRLLTSSLQARNYEVAWLGRSVNSDQNIKQFVWDLEKSEVDPGAITFPDVVIHLAGASVAGKRWTSDYKKLIRKSRIDSLNLLRKKFDQEGKQIDHLISGSAIGYYGYDNGGVWKKEESRFGDDFLATVCKEWEAAAGEFVKIAKKVSVVRTGLVLSPHDGLIAQMKPTTRLGLAAPLGNGHQYMSWIHESDVVGGIIHILENRLDGAFNLVAPNPVTNREFTQQLARSMGKPRFLPPIPGFILKVLTGEIASSITGSIRASSEKLEKSGYTFQFNELSTALKKIV